MILIMAVAIKMASSSIFPTAVIDMATGGIQTKSHRKAPFDRDSAMARSVREMMPVAILIKM
jgi:hypothetical protein